MPQYLVAGYLPDDFDPSTVDESMGRKIHELNKEMIAAGVRKFACGLGAAKALRTQSDGEVMVTDGPYLEAKEHIGGFWILECADMDEAVAWALKGVAATGGRSRCGRFSSCRRRSSRPTIANSILPRRIPWPCSRLQGPRAQSQAPARYSMARLRGRRRCWKIVWLPDRSIDNGSTR